MRKRDEIFLFIGKRNVELIFIEHAVCLYIPGVDPIRPYHTLPTYVGSLLDITFPHTEEIFFQYFAFFPTLC